MRPFRSTLAAVCVLLVIVGGLFAHPRQTHAFGAIPNLPQVTIDIPQTSSNIIDKIWRAVDRVLKTVVAVAYKSGLQYFANKIAYDTASYLATGGEGGKPAFITKSWGAYLFGDGGVGDEALGEFFTTGIDAAIDEAFPTTPEDCAKYCIGDKFDTSPATGGVYCKQFKDPANGAIVDPVITPESYQRVLNEFYQCIETNQTRYAERQQREKLKGTLKSKVTLCSPISADIYAKIELTARSVFEPTRPQCSFNTIRKNLKQASIRINGRDIFRTDYRSLELKDLPEFAAYFNPVENDIGATLTLIAEGYQTKAEAVKTGEVERLASKGFKPVRDLITGEGKIPDDLSSEQAKEALIKQPTLSVFREFTGEAVADAIGTFTNTLVSKLFKRITQKGFNPRTDSSLASFGPQSGAIGFTRGAQLAFADILKTDFSTDVAIDLLSDLASCPPRGRGGERAPENCVITEQFRIAIENKLSVREAVEPAGSCPRCQGLLSRNLTFGFEASGTEPDFRAGLPYRSLIILRKHRVVPVGWELAALYIKNFAQARVTLGELIDAYDQCGQGGADPSPYCRLVDPNWVLKAPLSHCYREGSSEENVAAYTTPLCDTDTNGDGAILCPPDLATPPVERQSVCADQRSCIVEGGSEGCLAYGYCTKEKQVWTIEGETCPAQFASCLEVTKVGTDERRAFVVNTTDSTGCTRGASAGCRRYAKEYDPAAGGWVNSLAPDMNYFLNQSALDAAERSCQDSRAVGCTEYIRVRHSDASRRPFTVAEYQTLLPQVAVGGASYRDATREAETLYLNSQAVSCTGPAGNPGLYVGCALYTPRDQNILQADIPAKPLLASIDTDPANSIPDNTITAWNDECPAECVGYAKFEQSATNFEPGILLSPGVNFIPRTARQCGAQEAGCDEFTNLDEVARGGEGREYFTYLRQCVKPGSGEATYYTWQGSDTTGFQLKVWSLVPGAGGAPQVSGPKPEAVARGMNGTDCRDDFRSANPDLDCREFIDTSLNYYYRYFSMTTEATESCHPYRRTLDGTVRNANPQQSISCGAPGCREYRGGDGGAAEVIFSDTFEGGSIEPWTGSILPSNDSVAPPPRNHSLRVNGIGIRPALGIVQGRVYVLKLWARGEIAGSFSAQLTGDGSTDNFSAHTLTTTWKQYEFGPVAASGATGNRSLNVVFVAGVAYIDNVVLQTANVYAIKDSWVTPASCDQDPPPPGNQVLGAHLGCAAYGNQTAGGEYYFRRFSNLCPAEFAGCEALIDTQNSATPGVQTFYTGASSVTVPADELNFIISSEGARCEMAQAGCMVLGKARAEYSNNPGEIATTVLTDTVIKVDPDMWSGQLNAATALCTLEEEYCALWSAADSAVSIRQFKDPTAITCEYKTENNVSNWYRTGSSQFCPSVGSVCSNAPSIACTGNAQCPAGGFCGVGHCIGGRSMSLAVVNGIIFKDANLCTSNAECLDYSRPGSEGLCSQAVGLCPGQYSTCTEFRDPQLPQGCDNTLAYGEKRCKNNRAVRCVNNNACTAGTDDECSIVACDYYYVPRKDIRDALTCTSLNPEEGCVGLHETGGAPDSITTTPHCNNALMTSCKIDADCPTGGTCGYQ